MIIIYSDIDSVDRQKGETQFIFALCVAYVRILKKIREFTEKS
jgi:hypothetical protein